jgi:hypothetical protein
LFDPHQYFEQVSRKIKDWDRIATVNGNAFEISPVSGPWNQVLWRPTIEFHCGYILCILELHTRDKHNHRRKVKYHLMDSNKKFVFRVDNHDHPIPFSEPCHIEDGDERYEENDGRLGGITLREIGFLEVAKWVEMVMEGTTLPWRV